MLLYIMNYEIVNYQNKYLKYKKKYLDVTNVNKYNEFMSHINNFAHLDYATKYVMFGGDINDLIGYNLYGGGVASDALKAAYSAALTAHTPISLAKSVNDFAANVAKQAIRKSGQYALAIGKKATKAALVASSDALTFVENAYTKNILILKAMLEAFGRIAQAEFNKVFSDFFKMTGREKSCFYILFKSGVIAAAEAAEEAPGAIAATPAVILEKIINGSTAALNLAKATPNYVAKTFFDALITAKKLKSTTIELFKRLSEDDWGTIASAALTSITTWLHATMNDPTKNPFTEQIICFNDMTELLRITHIQLKKQVSKVVSTSAPAENSEDTQLLTEGDLSEEQIQIIANEINDSDGAYQRTDEVINTFRLCLKSIHNSLKIAENVAGITTAASAVTSLGLPSAVISGAVCAILHLIKKVVKNLYRVAEAAWFISATGNDQAFSIAISDYNKTLETSPFSSLFAMMNFPNQFTAYLQRLVLIKIAAQRKIPPALKIEHDAKLAVKLAQKEQFGFEPEDCYYFVESTTPYVPLINGP
jgi:hypothetical protein